MIITISRQFAAGGSEVGRLVAERLGWALVDNQVVDEVASRSGLPREEVARREEQAPGFIERLTRALAISAPEFVSAEGALSNLTEEQVVALTEKVVTEAAARGNVVLVGRAAPAVLGQRADALHVKVVAPLPDRIRRAMERMSLDAKDAAHQVHEQDANRARYHQEYYHRDWNDAVNYDMVLNTGRLGIPGAVDVIVRQVSGERHAS
jgi:cytidylate kinase